VSRSRISDFTHSNTPPEVLERIFVQRHRLLEKIVERIKRSMLTGNMHHALLIGPQSKTRTRNWRNSSTPPKVDIEYARFIIWQVETTGWMFY